jgi:hypothetical protein
MLFLQGSYKRWWNVSEGTQVGQGNTGWTGELQGNLLVLSLDGVHILFFRGCYKLNWRKSH